jgi:hypothetical protein
MDRLGKLGNAARKLFRRRGQGPAGEQTQQKLTRSESLANQSFYAGSDSAAEPETNPARDVDKQLPRTPTRSTGSPGNTRASISVESPDGGGAESGSVGAGTSQPLSRPETPSIEGPVGAVGSAEYQVFADAAIRARIEERGLSLSVNSVERWTSGSAPIGEPLLLGEMGKQFGAAAAVQVRDGHWVTLTEDQQKGFAIEERAVLGRRTAAKAIDPTSRGAAR